MIPPCTRCGHSKEEHGKLVGCTATRGCSCPGYTAEPAVPALRGSNVGEDATGALVCPEHDYICEHIEKVYREALDAPLPTRVRVVLFSKPEVTATVVLATHDELGNRKAWLETNGSAEAFLGFIGETEGRLVLRDLVIGYLRDAIDGGDVGCSSKYHVGDPTWKPSPVTTEQEALAVALEVLTTGTCGPCKELVPENVKLPARRSISRTRTKDMRPQMGVGPDQPVPMPEESILRRAYEAEARRLRARGYPA